jgi:integrase/recombinase XerD
MIRLQQKSTNQNKLKTKNNLDQYLEEWLAVSGLGTEPEAPLFPTLRHGRLTDRTPLPQANVHMMIQRRARTAGLRTKISAHSFRATGITTYLQNGGKLEIAQQMAGHESARTTGLYDRRTDQIALDEVERIAF